MKSLRLLLLSIALAVFPLFSAATSHDKSAQFAEGEVRKVDKETGKITLKHGPIANLEMPAMSMVFQVKDPALLDQVKAGDKIRFQAEKTGTQYTVTHIEPVK
jgi:Cu(I)/Ag(I) efflux system protein CusF